MQNNSANPLYVLGQEFLLEFSDLIGKSLSKYLADKWGDEWFASCVIQDRPHETSDISDLSFQMRQILDLNNQNFRTAIAMSFFRKAILEKSHLSALEMIRKSRNIWAHPDQPITLRDLHRLAFNIVALVPSDDKLSIKCKQTLEISDKEDHINKVVGLTSFFRMYRDSIEYRSELSKAIKSFRTTFEKLDKESDIYLTVTAQNHLLFNLHANYLIIQPLYYQLLLDQLIESRHLRTGAKRVRDDLLKDLQRNLNTGQALRYAEEFIDSIIGEVGKNNCNCDFCTIIAQNGLVQFKEESQTAVENLYQKILIPAENSETEEEREYWGTIPPLFLFIATVCAAQDGVDPEEVITEWNFDLLNPELSIADEAYDNEDVMEMAIKLIAIRNGVPITEVEKWELY